MLLISETDPRGPKAVALAADAGQWLKCRTRDGRKAYGIRSSADADHCYLVTRTSCTCKDFFHGRGRDCKHILAVLLHCQLVEEQQAPKVTSDSPELARILGRTKPRRGVIPAALIERED
jgi:uncharacterized Zn finger protein